MSQARMSSSRLPGKVVERIGNDTILGLHLKRLKRAKKLDEIVVAIADEDGADKIKTICEENGVGYVLGSVSDVLSRFYLATEGKKADAVVRVTSDCPLIDPACVDALIESFKDSGMEYSSNCIPPTLPDGMDAEIFTFKALTKAYAESTEKFDREHVTPFIRRLAQEEGLMGKWMSPTDYSQYRLTVDNIEDLRLVETLVEKVGSQASYLDYIGFLKANPSVLEINAKYTRNEGSKK